MEEVYCAQGCGHEERRHLACLPFVRQIAISNYRRDQGQSGALLY